MTYSLCVSLRLFLQGQQSLDSGPTLIQYDLNLTSYIYKEPISKQGHILRFQVDMDLGGTLFKLLLSNSVIPDMWT